VPGMRSFKELVEGKWDALPEQAFMYVGTVEEAAEQARKMEQENRPAPAAGAVAGPAK
jgi:F-type H+-transporting ATPase subunit beta